MASGKLVEDQLKDDATKAARPVTMVFHEQESHAKGVRRFTFTCSARNGLMGHIEITGPPENTVYHLFVSDQDDLPTKKRNVSAKYHYLVHAITMLFYWSELPDGEYRLIDYTMKFGGQGLAMQGRFLWCRVDQSLKQTSHRPD